jgi:hypothetical protein
MERVWDFGPTGETRWRHPYNHLKVREGRVDTTKLEMNAWQTVAHLNAIASDGEQSGAAIAGAPNGFGRHYFALLQAAVSASVADAEGRVAASTEIGRAAGHFSVAQVEQTEQVNSAELST